MTLIDEIATIVRARTDAPRQHYGFAFEAEPDAPQAVRRLCRMLVGRFEDRFTPDEFRGFRDALSAIGIGMREIETWTESERKLVL